MDNDISHAVETRLQALEARLDKLDGGPPKEEESSEEALYEPEPTTKSSRSKN